MDTSATIRLPTLPDTKDKKKGKEEAPKDASATAGVRSEASDQVLMLQVAEGNREALAILFRRHARTVRSIAYRLVRDGAEADDLVQDVFLLVHRDAKAFDPAKGTAQSWVFQIAHRRGISRHRYLTSRRFYQQVDLDNLAGELEDPRTTVQPGRSIQEMFGESDFDKVWAELSRNQRETLRLYFFEGYSFAEIAVELGQSRGNIKHHYFRGLERLRKDLLLANRKATEQDPSEGFVRPIPNKQQAGRYYRHFEC